ncbi:carboxypeptidase-like regulatory domain-containing protein [Desertivirga xinjiangensis]|uniref:carboxypeptidase-like regulatory domain-containing protein n=1 Tax=Desertivirga xinjiangensis TaxID=539206 RepID=UPI00210A4BB2|nr:carboxypeptidase-like regulatory domain-containing protein [Pedobacter xinjiangensis]
MRSLITILLINHCLLFICSTHAQTVHGTVTDTLKNAIPYAGITVKNSDDIIVAYTLCKENGSFSLSIPDNLRAGTLRIEAAILGYKKQSKPLNESIKEYSFILFPEYQHLKTVVVKDSRPMLKVRGDTINYKVSDFSNPQDRVIGDVLKKLPGIEVSENGKISYNGRAISNFYIDGDNLLDDKYNIATQTVPNSIVENIQILENDQPIKILRKRSYSENVAVNITFKKDAKLKLLGQGIIAGGAPGKYDVNVNGMTFKDKYKAINYVKANNTGTDVANDLISHNASEYLKRAENLMPKSMLSLGTAGTPDLPKNRFLFNQGLLLNFNNLVRFKRDLQLKANVSYLHDVQNQQYQKLEQVYLSNDTVAYDEVQNSRSRINGFVCQVNINVNKDRYYLSNSFSGDIGINSDYAMLTANNSYIEQNLKEKRRDFSNELTFLQSLNKELILNIYSYTSYTSKPEFRIINPGISALIFNDGHPYKGLEQRTDIPTWVTNNYISIRSQFRKFSFQQKLGFSSQSQLLQSDLHAVDNNFDTNAIDSSSNHLSWSRKKFYASSEINFSATKFKLNLAFPISLQQTDYQDDQYKLSQSSSRIYFNPLLQLKYQTGLENYISFDYDLMTNPGSLTDVYRGYILHNYRTLIANNTALTEQEDQNVRLGFHYRKGIKLFFYNINISYKHTSANNITSSVVTPEFQRKITLPFANNTDSWAITGLISKYLFFIKSTASFSPTFQLNKINILQNGLLLPYKTKVLAVNAGIETKLSPKVNLNYRNYLTHLNSFSSETPNVEFIQIRQHTGINYTPLDKLLFRVSGDYYITHQQFTENRSSFFTDFTTQVNIPKRKIKLELNLINLFNTTLYSTTYLSSNLFSASTHKILGRMVMGRLIFQY